MRVRVSRACDRKRRRFSCAVDSGNEDQEGIPAPRPGMDAGTLRERQDDFPPAMCDALGGRARRRNGWEGHLPERQTAEGDVASGRPRRGRHTMVGIRKCHSRRGRHATKVVRRPLPSGGTPRTGRFQNAAGDKALPTTNKARQTESQPVHTCEPGRRAAERRTAMVGGGGGARCLRLQGTWRFRRGGPVGGFKR